MNLLQVFIEAFRAMNANRLRTSLTMLGIIIGITSVVMMLAVGDSARKFISKELEVLGSNLMIISPGANRTQGVKARTGTAPSLSVDDAVALDGLSSLNGAAPALQGFFQISAGSENSNNAVLGITPAMFKVRNWKVEQGDYFSDSDIRGAARMVVIGKKIAADFFYKSNPIGKFIRIDNVPFQVVGVLQGEGRMFDGGDLGDMVLIPITTARATLMRSAFPSNVHYVVVQGKNEKLLKDADEDIKEVLRDRHRIRLDQPDDFRIDNLASIAETGAKISAGLSAMLGAIGAISLVVGGIGIMNIMLVSVTERTREIGIRMAIGAKPRDVLLQFLTEAVVICLVGGILGILCAVGGAAAITSTGTLEVVVGAGAMIIACGFASFVGIFFGFYPARRASRLLPVDCLRYE
ncbi:ABC transporter permease [Undibacterium terreum]|uniref:Multidrug ABC transporter substrate-binding protein n=1 Tax=Undibacterium terreum TaxID=1224302 RepID=A0A916UV08_9BURK|nr:ABC transporter permease [Undibacterium terreum]GGC86430.1 multidrug ABC transporter substrate-binding protein [Undibacterium terreum]